LFDIETGRQRRALDRFTEARGRVVSKGAAFVLPAHDYGIAMALAADGALEDARAALDALIGVGAGGWAYILGRAYVGLAEVTRGLGDNRPARKAAEAGLEVALRIGDRAVAGEAQLVLGRLAVARSDWTDAKRLCHEALQVAVQEGTPRLPAVLEILAAVAGGLEGYVDAARILGAADRAWSEAGMVPWSHQRSERKALEAGVRESLDAADFERAYSQGRALTAAEAAAYVRRTRGERKRPSRGWESLTPTELEVARHTASGLTNPEIAERMFISRDTVRTHLSHIFAKLGLRNRSELARHVAARTDISPD
jgi:DNA-binding CsgD family transcriptional regulator